MPAELARLAGAGYRPPTIARALNARGVPTVSGRGQWWPSVVRRQLDPGSWAAYMRSYRHRAGR